MEEKGGEIGRGELVGVMESCKARQIVRMFACSCVGTNHEGTEASCLLPPHSSALKYLHSSSQHVIFSTPKQRRLLRLLNMSSQGECFVILIQSIVNTSLQCTDIHGVYHSKDNALQDHQNLLD